MAVGTCSAVMMTTATVAGVEAARLRGEVLFCALFHVLPHL